MCSRIASSSAGRATRRRRSARRPGTRARRCRRGRSSPGPCPRCTWRTTPCRSSVSRLRYVDARSEGGTCPPRPGGELLGRDRPVGQEQRLQHEPPGRREPQPLAAQPGDRLVERGEARAGRRAGRSVTVRDVRRATGTRFALCEPTRAENVRGARRRFPTAIAPLVEPRPSAATGGTVPRRSTVPVTASGSQLRRNGSSGAPRRAVSAAGAERAPPAARGRRAASAASASGRAS